MLRDTYAHNPIGLSLGVLPTRARRSGQKPMTVTDRVETRQVAPTVLKLLGLDHTKLTACMTEGCDPLPGLSY